MIKSIENKPLDELIKLRDDLDKLIIQRQKERKKELKQQFYEMAQKDGLSVDDILDLEPPKRGRKEVKAPIRYRKESNTWTGKGRKPKWVLELIDGGGDIEDYLIGETGGDSVEGIERLNG